MRAAGQAPPGSLAALVRGGLPPAAALRRRNALHAPYRPPTAARVYILAVFASRPATPIEGIDHSTFYRHLQRRPELVPALQSAQLHRDRVRNAARIEEAETELKRRGIDGWSEPIFDAKGRQCGERRRFSDACLIFFLKAHKPDVYADKSTTIVATQFNLTPSREKEILTEWRRRLGAVPEPPRSSPAPQSSYGQTDSA